MATTISPCPFCGMMEARLGGYFQEYETVEPRSADGALSVNMDGFGWYWVECTECGANGPKWHGATYSTGNKGPKNYRRDREKAARAIRIAVDTWNRRALPLMC